MAMQTLLQMVTREAKRLGLPVPTTAFSNTDPTWTQSVEIIQQLGDDLVLEHDWSILTTPKVSAIAALNYTAIALPADYKKMVDNSKIWRPSVLAYLIGPVTPARWQELTTYGIGFIPGAWRLAFNTLNVYGVNPTENVNWEYISKYWIVDTLGVTPKAEWSADNDTTRLPDDLIKKGFTWLWKRAKGFDYSEEKDQYDGLKERLIAADRGMVDINLSGPHNDEYLGEGTWPGMVVP